MDFNGGRHVKLEDGAERYEEVIKDRTISVFTHGPRSKKAIKNIDEKLAKFIKKNNINVYPHASYFTHIMKSDKGDEHLSDQLESCKMLHAKGFVVHVDKTESDQIAKRMLEVKPIIERHGVPLFIEAPGIKVDPKGKTTYETPESINRLDEKIRNKGLNHEIHFKHCIDTAHLWAMGQDISTYDAMKEWLDGIEDVNCIGLFHINGSKNECGAGKDKHAIPMSELDLMWGKLNFKDTGFKYILEFAKEHDIPFILEINRDAKNTDKDNKRDEEWTKTTIKLIKKIYN